MRTFDKLLFALFLIFCVGPESVAQNIPKLKRADEVSTGVFANGIEYCFVNNKASVGKIGRAHV